MKSLLDKAIESEEITNEMVLEVQAKMRVYNKVISLTVTPLENPVRLKIIRNTYASYLKTKK